MKKRFYYHSITLILVVAIFQLLSVACASTYSKPATTTTAPAIEPTLDTLALGDPELKDKFLMVRNGLLYSCADGSEISFEKLIDDLSTRRVIYLGESHTSMSIHQLQTRIIKALYERNPKLMIGMEFFQRTDNPVLEKWSAGELSEEELIRKTGWYAGGGGYNFSYYAPFMNFARDKHFPVIGLNIPRAIIRKISRQGYDSLTPEERGVAGEVDITHKEHRQLISFYFGGTTGGHGAAPADAKAAEERFNRMYTSQSTWDVAMSDSVLRALDRFDGIFVVIVGSGHTTYKLGMNRRLHEKSPLPAATVIPIALEEGDQGVRVVRSIGDYVAGVSEDMNKPYFPNYGARATDKDGKVVVGILFPGTIALKAGLKQGDVIISLDGSEVKDVTDLRLRMSKKQWGNTVRLTVLREGQEMEFTLTAER